MRSRDDPGDVSDEAIDHLLPGPESGRLYLVESYWPEVSPARVAAVDVETSRLLEELGDDLPAARHLGSLLIAEDELLLRLFAGGTAELINAANVRAGVPVERVVAIVTIAPATRAGRLWICESCGLVYDAKIGDPDGGIPPATLFEALDDSWSCPMCGAHKRDFTPDPWL